MEHSVRAMHIPAMKPGGACATQVRSGDYVLWDPRLPHTTGESDAFSRSSAPRQVLYCAFMLARDNDTLSAEQRACRKSGLHMSWSPSAQRYEEAGRGYSEAPLTPLGQARCDHMHAHCVYHAYAQHTSPTPPLTTTSYYDRRSTGTAATARRGASAARRPGSRISAMSISGKRPRTLALRHKAGEAAAAAAAAARHGASRRRRICCGPAAAAAISSRATRWTTRQEM